MYILSCVNYVPFNKKRGPGVEYSPGPGKKDKKTR